MRRIWLFAAVLLLIMALSTGVYAQTEASSVSFHASVSGDSSCQVTVTALLHLEQAVKSLTFPVPAEAENITLNGSRARVNRTDTAKLVDLSGIAGSIAGDFSVTITYTLRDLVQQNENEFLELTLPMLSGFTYPIKRMEFSVTMPGPFSAAPAYTSGYHKTDIEKSLTSSVSGAVIAGSSVKELKDHETLAMTLLVTEEMFPQRRIVLPDFALTNGLIIGSFALALLYWLLTLRCKRPKRASVSVPPDGYSAGQMGCVLSLQGADLTMMVLSWAELGYVFLRLDKQGRVYIHKRMEMGNERTGFEQRCFKNLFGKRSNMVDTAGYHYALCCQAAEKLPPNIRSFIHPRSGNPAVFRALASLMGLLSGVQLAIAIAAGAALQWLLIILFGILGAVAAWQLLRWADELFLYNKRRIYITLAVCVIWWVVGILCGLGGTVVLILLALLLSGLMLSYGGRRTEAGLQAMTEVLGLRRYLRRLDSDELQRITQNNPEYFFQMIPYALALGIGQRFAKRFGKRPIPRCPYLQAAAGEQLTAAQWYDILQRTVAGMNARRQKLPLEKLLGILQNLIKH